MKAILTYHSIDDSDSVVSVSASQLVEHVKSLALASVTVVSVADLLRRSGPEHVAAITFDDAYTNFLTSAWPVLRENNFPVTLFVPTQFVGASNRWASTRGGDMPSLTLLTWDQLGLLAEQGVELGAHTRSHPDLRRLSDDEIADEICGSLEDIASRTGAKARGFAYPYGRLDDRSATIAADHCEWACTTELRPVSATDDRYRLPRLDSYFLRGPARLDAYGSTAFRSYISLRATVRRARNR